MCDENETGGQVVSLTRSTGQDYTTCDAVRKVLIKDANSICAHPLNPQGWWIGDAGSVRYCDGQTVSLVAGDSHFGDNYEQEDEYPREVVGVRARFSYVTGIICTRDKKRLYVSDRYNCKIKTINLESEQRMVSTVVGNGRRETVDGKGVQASIHSPAQLAFDRRSSSSEDESVLWIAAKVLRRLDLTTRTITTVDVPIHVSDAGDGLKLSSVECSSNGTLILAHRNTLYSFNPQSRQVDRLAGAGGLDGDSVRCMVLVDSSSGEQCVYISLNGAHCIRRVTLT